MAFEDVKVGGLASREFDERVPFDRALVCQDCYVDRDGIQGRNGYQVAHTGTVGVTSLQALARYRPSATSARTVAVAGGKVYTITDPTSEAATDGMAAMAGVGSITGATNVSPIEITSNGHGRITGDQVQIMGVLGNTAANGTWTVTLSPTDANKFTLDGSTGNGAYTGGGTWELVPFGTGDKVSIAQLGKHLYVGTDSATRAMRRLNSGYAVESLQAISQGAKPKLRSFDPLAFTKFKDLSAPTYSGSIILQNSGNSGMGGLQADCRCLTATNNGNDDPASQASVTFTLPNTTGVGGSGVDVRACDWLAVGVSAHDGGGFNTAQQVEVQLARDSSGSPADVTTVGVCYDVPPGGGSPNLLYCDLRGVPAAVRGAVRYMRFYLSGTSGGKFVVYGYCFLPSRPASSPERYYVTCQDETTLQESPPTEALEVTVTNSDVTLPTYPDCHMSSGGPRNHGASLDILAPSNGRIWNREAGKAMPTRADIGAIKQIDQVLHSSWRAGQVLRLWKETAEGRRLVTTQTLTAGDILAGTYRFVDTAGLTTLANAKFKPGGTPPPCNALAARAGRLIAAGVGNEGHRLYISSFTAPSATSDPFPQFPQIAVEEADGWAFDIGTSNAEQIQGLVNGDALYVLTNEAVYSMFDLTAPVDGRTPEFTRVFQRGSIGRRAAIYVENTLFWAAYDGIYAGRNRTGATELSEPIRDLYMNTFAPDVSTILLYKNRKLYAIRGTKMLRFDFVTGRWSGPHTLAHTVVDGARWLNPGATVEQMWMYASDFKLYRWQDSATSDGSTPIQPWVYSTGYDVSARKTTLGSLFADVTGGAVDVYAHKGGETDSILRFEQAVGESVLAGNRSQTAYKWRLRITGPNSASVRRIMVERQSTDGRGVKDGPNA
jgi:hypothetical protein